MRPFYFLLVIICFSSNLFGQTFENISVTEAKELIENSTENELFTIIDVRTPDEYLPEHIAGAFMRNF